MLLTTVILAVYASFLPYCLFFLFFSVVWKRFFLLYADLYAFRELGVIV